jgi:hypothetical protein
MTITTKDTFGKEKTYEVVDKIPAGFFVWNIGENMGTDEYIPLAEWMEPSNKSSYDINPETLKAIKLEKHDVEILREAAGYGVASKKDAERAVRRNAKSYMAIRKKMLAEMALPIFENITE